MGDFNDLKVWHKAHALFLNIDRDFARFLRYAFDSAKETEHHLITFRDLKVVSLNDFQSAVDQVIEVRKMLWGLMKYLRRNDGEDET